MEIKKTISNFIPQIGHMRYFTTTLKLLLIINSILIMKPINIVMAVIGGVVAGAAVGLLFAPDKGSNTRTKIADAVKKAGIKLNPKKMEELVDDITEEIEKDL